MSENNENNTNNTEIITETTGSELIPAQTAEQIQAYVPTMWNTPKLMQNAWKTAEMLSKTPIIPQSYQNSPGSCLIAIDIANRMNMPPLLVLQNLFIVQGRPAWSGQFCIAAINGCGQFEPLDYIYVGEAGTPSYGCYAQAKRIKSNTICKSTAITLQMAKDEGWSTKNGSKWNTMPEQMLKYRAASFFARAYCPEVLIGLQTADEIDDVKGSEPEKAKVTFKLDR